MSCMKIAMVRKAFAGKGFVVYTRHKGASHVCVDLIWQVEAWGGGLAVNGRSGSGAKSGAPLSTQTD